MLTKPSREEMEEAKRKQDSLEQVLQQQEQQQLQEQQATEGTTTSPVILEDDEVNDPIIDSINWEKEKSAYGVFATARKGDEKIITLENELLKLNISTLGARPYNVVLKDYQNYDGDPLVLFTGDSTRFRLNFFAQNRSIATDELYFEPSVQEEVVMATEASGEKRVSLKVNIDQGKYLEYVYTIFPNSYLVDFKINITGLEEIIARNANSLDLYWEMYSPSHERGRDNENQYTSIYYKYFQDEVDKFNSRSKKELVEESISTRLRWIAFKQHFFSAVLISDNYFSNAYLKYESLPETNEDYLKKFVAEIGMPYQAENTQQYDMGFYFGPNHFNTLKKFDIELQQLVELGGWIIRWINRFVIIPLFNWLNNFTGNYGIIILILTLIIKMALFPLTYKSYLSQAKMRVLKPQIDEINAKIPKEKAMERQQATMALYKKAGVNPMGGCLPMLLQFPILIAMFRFFPSSIELRQESFLWAEDLSTYDSILDLPFTIPFYGDHVSLFTLLMTISTILTMKINNQATTTSTQMPGMKTMMYIMPVMFMFILNSFSAGLTYYYFLANLITFGQNAVFKRYVDENKILKKLNENKKKPQKKSGFQKRLEDAAKKRGYKMPKK
jgi:YidC/Oxa1 family membrane protein insertase